MRFSHGNPLRIKTCRSSRFVSSRRHVAHAAFLCCVRERIRGIRRKRRKILAATSRWCAVDFASGKLLSPKAFPEQNYTDESVYDPARSAENLQGKTARFPMEEGKEKFFLKIANSEYDHNMHVNNTRYADYCLNCFSVEELSARRVTFFRWRTLNSAKREKLCAFFAKTNRIAA